MKNIKIGADELILWLRKNRFHNEITNDDLGKEIRKIIENLNGKLVCEDVKVIWPINDSNLINGLALPQTAAQYEIDINKLKDVYIMLVNINLS